MTTPQDKEQIVEQARREAEELRPAPRIEQFATLGEWNGAMIAYSRYINGYAAALVAERSKPPVDVEVIMEVVWPWIMQSHGGVPPPDGSKEHLEACLTKHLNP